LLPNIYDSVWLGKETSENYNTQQINTGVGIDKKILIVIQTSQRDKSKKLYTTLSLKDLLEILQRIV